MNQTPTTRLVFSAATICGRPTTIMLESSVAMKMPTVVTVSTTHLYSNHKTARLLSVSAVSTQRSIKRPEKQGRSERDLDQQTRKESALINNLGRGPI